jgi:hypothetical protein
MIRTVTMEGGDNGSLQTKIDPKTYSLFTLAFVGLLLISCTINPASLLNQPALEQQQMEIMLETYMASMKLRDTGLPYLFFSTGLQAIRTENELAEELSGPGYLAYEGFESLEVISIEEIQVDEEDGEAKQIIAEIRYESGERGLLLAELGTEGDRLVINSIDIFVSPDKTWISQE